MGWIWGPWTCRRYALDRMSLGELVRAFFTYYAVLVYLLLAAIAAGLAVHWATDWRGPLLAVVLTLALYPLIEYLLHRYLLHSRLLYRLPQTARLWKRIHYDHHRDPHDLGVLFGALYTTLPTIALITLVIGGLVAGRAGAAAAFATGCLVFTFYEFCHSVQHLPYKPRNRWLRDIKRRHLAHHFHNEQGNFGITSNLWDRLFGTFYDPPGSRPRSMTARNLGYDGEEREKYPWVARLSEPEEENAPPRRAVGG